MNGKLHREDGPAVEYANGSKAWYLNGKLHREDGPAVEYSNGDKEWWIDGNGPAYESADGSKGWWLNGIKLTEEEFNTRNKKEMTVVEIEQELGYSIKIVK